MNKDNSKIKKLATISMIFVLALGSIFISLYTEYIRVGEDIERIEKSIVSGEAKLNNTIYTSLRNESQAKVDRLAKEVGEKLREEYQGDYERYKRDYDNLNTPSEDNSENTLVTILSEHLLGNEKYFYVESDANDIFVTTEDGVALDESDDCSTEGLSREFAEEIPYHHNPKLAELVFDGIIAGEDNLFWRFRNTTNSDDIGVTNLDISVVLNQPLDELVDYEFLSVGYIYDNEDIMGIPRVTEQGFRQKTRRLMIVQGFNIYEQVQDRYKLQYVQVRNERNLRIQALEDVQKALILKTIFTLMIVFISLISISSIQDDYIKLLDCEACKEGERGNELK